MIDRVELHDNLPLSHWREREEKEREREDKRILLYGYNLQHKYINMAII